MADGVTSPRVLPRPRPGWAVAAFLVCVAALLVGYPIVAVLRAVLDGGIGAAASGFDGLTLTAVADSVGVSLAVTLLAVAAGTAAAFVTERSSAPGRRWLRLALLLPLVVPGFVATLGWVGAYGTGGLLFDLTGLSWQGLFGAPGVVVVLAVESAPLAYLVVAAGLAARVEPDMERAARAAGAGAWETARTVTLPLLRPQIGAATLLVFVASMGAFAVPAVLGRPAGFSTITTRIYQDLAFSAQPEAFARVLVLSLLLMVLAVLAAMSAGIALPGRALVLGGGPSGSAARTASRRSWAVAAATWLIVGATVFVPLIAVVLQALTRAPGLAPVPANWTLANISGALDQHFFPSLGVSLVLSLTAATGAVAMGLLLAVTHRRRLGNLLLAGFALPGSALAVAVLLAYGPWLGDSLAIILLAYLAKFLALGHRPIAAALEGTAPSLTHAARASGAGPFAAFRTVVLPLLRPALLGAWLLVFLFAIHELTISSLLYGPKSQTLAVTVLELQQLGDPTVTAALGTILTLLVLVPSVLVVALTPVAPWRRR